MPRAALLVALIAGAIVLSKLLFEDWLGIFPEPVVRAWVTHPGTAGAVAVIALLAVDLVLPVPSSLVMIWSGAAFGLGWGSLFAFVGSVGGEWLGFELVRRYGRGAAARLAGDTDLTQLERLFNRYGAALVVMTRALPIVMETTSVVAGLSAMRRRTFLLASTLGTAPIVVVYAYAGMRARETGSLVPALVMVIAVSGCAWIWYRATRQPD